MAVAAAGLTLAVPAYADLDVADYAPTAGAASAREQAQVARRIEEEQKAEAERARRASQAAANQAAAERVRLDARPYPLRITELRCTRCHVADAYLARRHTWIGWSLVTLRMKYLNGAVEISETERAAIVNYLTLLQGVEGGDAINEYGALAAAVCTPLAAAWTVIALRRRRSGKRTDFKPT